jgi:hypothetical protein
MVSSRLFIEATVSAGASDGMTLRLTQALGSMEPIRKVGK